MPFQNQIHQLVSMLHAFIEKIQFIEFHRFMGEMLLVLTGTELIRTEYYQPGTVNLANELLLVSEFRSPRASIDDVQ